MDVEIRLLWTMEYGNTAAAKLEEKGPALEKWDSTNPRYAHIN